MWLVLYSSQNEAAGQLRSAFNALQVLRETELIISLDLVLKDD